MYMYVARLSEAKASDLPNLILNEPHVYSIIADWHKLFVNFTFFTFSLCDWKRKPIVLTGVLFECLSILGPMRSEFVPLDDQN